MIALLPKYENELVGKLKLFKSNIRYDFFVREIDCTIWAVTTTYPSFSLMEQTIKSESKMLLYKGCPVLFKGLQLIYVADVPFSKLMWKRKKVIV